MMQYSRDIVGRPTARQIAAAVAKADALSDRGAAGLAAWANAFIDAHSRAPGGLTIEVGTRIGGSAFLWAVLLDWLYGGAEHAPLLWTVDPYGSKPYVSGDTRDVEAPIYDQRVYAVMKQNLAAVPFHTHWMLPSSEFFGRLFGASYWEPGARSVGMLDLATGRTRQMPIGERRTAGRDSTTFVLLDGEHTREAILIDAELALKWVRVGGAIVVDNVDSDPLTRNALEQAYGTAVNFSPEGQWATILP